MIANIKITIGWTWPWCQYSDFAEIPPPSLAEWRAFLWSAVLNELEWCCSKRPNPYFCVNMFFFAIQNSFPFNSWQAQLLIRINHYFRSFPFSPSAWWISLVSWSLELLWAVMLLFIHISPIPLEPTLLILSPNLNL